MAISYVGKGTFAGNAGALTLTMPTHVEDDLLLAFIHTANQAIAISPVDGWKEAPSSPQSTGTAAAAGGVRLTVFYKFANTSVESSLVTTDSGSVQSGIVVAYRGVDMENPFDVTAGSTQAATTSMVWPGVTTTKGNCWIVHGCAQDTDAGSTATSGTPTNGNLSSLTERHDQTVNTGAGGGVVILDGLKAAAGATGNTTSTGSTSVTHAYVTLAIAPKPIRLRTPVHSLSLVTTVDTPLASIDVKLMSSGSRAVMTRYNSATPAVYYSDDGETWTSATGPGQQIEAIGYAAGRFHLFDVNGDVYSSANGATGWEWNTAFTAAGTNFGGISNDKHPSRATATWGSYYAVTTNGTTWTEYSGSGGPGVSDGDLTYHAPVSNYCRYSTDGGVSWTQGDYAPAFNTVMDLVYGNGRWVGFTNAGGDYRAYSTTVAGRWGEYATIAGTDYYTHSAYVNGCFVAVERLDSASKAILSPNGLDWDTVTLPVTAGYWRDATDLGNRYILASDTKVHTLEVVTTSPGCVCTMTGTLTSVPIEGLVGRLECSVTATATLVNINPIEVARGGANVAIVTRPSNEQAGVIVGRQDILLHAYDSSQTAYVSSNDNGETWTHRTGPGVAFANDSVGYLPLVGKFYIRSSSSFLSSNGIDWTDIGSTPTGIYSLGTTSDGKLFYTSNTFPRIVYSTNGLDWIDAGDISNQILAGENSIAFDGVSRYVIIGWNDFCLWTDDLSAGWTSADMLYTTVQQFAFGQGRFIAGCDSQADKLQWSVDGESWTAIDMPSTGRVWRSVAYDPIGEAFIAAGGNDAGWAISLDGGVTWTVQEDTVTHLINPSAVDGTVFIVRGNGNTDLRKLKPRRGECISTMKGTLTDSSGEIYGALYSRTEVTAALTTQILLNASAASVVTATASLSTGLRTSLSAAIAVARTAAPSLSAAILQARTATASITAAIRAAQTRTTSIDSAVRLARTSTTNIGAALLQARSATAALGAAIRAARNASVALGAVVVTSRSATADINAAVRAARTSTANVSAAIRAARTAVATLDAAVRAARTSSASLDAAIDAPKTLSAAVGAAVRVARSATSTIDGALQLARSASASLDASINAATQQTATVSIGAAIRLARSATASVDAAVRAARSATTSIDSAVRAARSATTSIGAAVRFARSSASSVNAAVRVARSAASTIDAAIRAPATAAANLGAAVRSGAQATSTIGAAIRAQDSATASLEGAVRYTATITADLGAAVVLRRAAVGELTAAIVAPLSAQTSIGASVLQAHTASASLGALVLGGFTAYATLDAAVRHARPATVSLSAAIIHYGSTLATASVDAAIVLARSRTASLGAAIRAAQSLSGEIDAAISLARSAASSVGAAIQQARSNTASIDAVVRRTASASVDLSSAIAAARTVTAAIDSAIRAPHTDALSLNAVISGGTAVNATLDAAILAARSATAALGAAVAVVRSSTANLGAAVAVARTASSTLQAAVQLRRTVIADFSGAILQARSSSVALSSAILQRQQVVATLGASIAAGYTASVSIDAVVLGGTLAQVSLTAAVQEARFASVSLGAVISSSLTTLVTADIDAMIYVAGAATALMSAAVLHRPSNAASLNAYVLPEGSLHRTVSASFDAAIDTECHTKVHRVLDAVTVPRTDDTALVQRSLDGIIVRRVSDAAQIKDSCQ